MARQSESAAESEPLAKVFDAAQAAPASISIKGVQMRLIIVSLSALLIFGACSGSSEPAEDPSGDTEKVSADASISAVDNEFEPTELALEAGEEVTVEFTNGGDGIHTFTSEELGFDTGNVAAGETAQVTFTAPEEETEFVCTIHAESSNMTGVITTG